MAANPTVSTSKKITITLPSVNLQVLSEKITKFIANLYASVNDFFSKRSNQSSDGLGQRSRRVKLPQMNKFNFDKRKMKIIFPIFLGVIVLFGLINIVRSLPDAKSDPTKGNVRSINAPDSIAVINLDKKFSFPLLDSKGKEVGQFDYVIESAALQKQIIVQGQRATAVNGRVFLILNLKITNNLKQMIQLNTRDYLRLILNSNKNEQLAPDIHNDPVEVQAISTKYTRVGVAIDEKDAKKLIQLKVGEIDSEKQSIDLNFKF